MKGPRGNDQSGMTVVEMAMAIAVLGFIMVGVIAVFTILLTSTTRSGDRAAAQMVAQNQLELVAKNQNMADRTGVDHFYSHGDELPVAFNYQVEVTRLSRPSEQTKAYFVQATVYWVEDTETKGQGDKLSVSLGRIVRVGP